MLFRPLPDIYIMCEQDHLPVIADRQKRLEEDGTAAFVTRPYRIVKDQWAGFVRFAEMSGQSETQQQIDLVSRTVREVGGRSPRAVLTRNGDCQGLWIDATVDIPATGQRRQSLENALL